MNFFVCTINSFYDVFSADNENESFENIINDSSFIIEALKDDGVVVNKIPNYLKQIYFKNTKNFQKFDSDYLKSNCVQWLENCLNELKAKLQDVFKHVSCLKNLVLIRDAVLDFEINLVSKHHLPETNLNFNWDSLCQNLFDKNIQTWNDLISPFYYDQSKVIYFKKSLNKKERKIFFKLMEILID